jgi:hypothetical protein
MGQDGEVDGRDHRAQGLGICPVARLRLEGDTLKRFYLLHDRTTFPTAV